MGVVMETGWLELYIGVRNVPVNASLTRAIAVDATCGVIENLTGQPLLLKINGAAAASQSIPTGGSFCWANPAVAGSTPITAMSLTTTAIQSGAGRIVYHLFGDPT